MAMARQRERTSAQEIARYARLVRMSVRLEARACAGVHAARARCTCLDARMRATPCRADMFIVCRAAPF